MDKAVFSCGCVDMIITDTRTDPFTGGRSTVCGDLVKRTSQCGTDGCIG